MFAPIPVTTNDVLPLAVTSTLPLDTGILILLVPLLIPDELMAIGGPGAIAAFLKFQKMDMGDIVSKLEKL
jgi:hypothetical protein